MAKNDLIELEKARHTAAHLLAAAVKDLWPGTHNAIGPAIEDGFYQDFDFGEHSISEDDLPKIEQRMRELLESWKSFDERSVSPEEAKEMFADNPYKLEILEELAAEDKEITVNDPGNFLDLCKGGHSEKPKESLQHFKLLSIAGAYWRGDENNTMLTRIYGTAFPSEKELNEHLELLEEAKKRDHRKLGQELDLFAFSSLVGPGLPLFTPRGTTIRRELETFLQSLQEPAGYERVTIPHLAKNDLYKTSGHWDKFGDDIFHVTGKNDAEFVLKPMNCPHHTQIYASRPRSYRELPLRFSEVTMMYRDEQAGQLQGLSRVRAISIDDAHVFCTPEQINDEIENVYQIIDQFYEAFDFEMSVRLSLRDPQEPDKYLGDDSVWDKAEAALRDVLKEKGVEFIEEEGEAAFYGPKIDFVARDSLKRDWQLATIQLDFNLPERFDLTYTDDAGESQRAVMIHRAISGSLERFIAILLEHYAGELPLWLSPTQVAVLPISDEQQTYAEEVAGKLTEVGVRCEVDSRGESIGKKIRDAEIQKVPVMFVIGKREAEAGTVSVRSKKDGDQGAIDLGQSIADLAKQIADRSA